MKRSLGPVLLSMLMACALPWSAYAQPGADTAVAKQMVVVSTDIGDDIDDGFSLGLLLNSPEFNLLGIASAWGDTELRARMLAGYLQKTGHGEVPIAVGQKTKSAVTFTQARWARRQPQFAAKQDAASMILDQARRHPGEVTLLVLGPMTDAAIAAKRDPATFAKLKRIVMMGGSVLVGYGTSDYRPATAPVPEYNIVSDISAAQTVFTAGVPIDMLPLDSTKVGLPEAERVALFAHGSPVTDVLTQLYYQWRDSDSPWASATPTLFDVVPVAWMLDPGLCPMQSMHIDVDDKGYTRAGPGPVNVQVCLKLDKPALIHLYMHRLLGLAD